MTPQTSSACIARRSSRVCFPLHVKYSIIHVLFYHPLTSLLLYSQATLVRDMHVRLDSVQTETMSSVVMEMGTSACGTGTPLSSTGAHAFILLYSFIAFTHSLINPFTHSPIHAFIHSFIHSLIHPPTPPLTAKSRHTTKCALVLCGTPMNHHVWRHVGGTDSSSTGINTVHLCILCTCVLYVCDFVCLCNGEVVPHQTHQRGMGAWGCVLTWLSAWLR